MREADPPEHSLKRALGAFDIVMLGIGAIIGAGIFATIGTAVAGDALRPGAGPGIVLSFILTAVACGFCGLCYAEFASIVPISGSAYTYSYATLGELVAWIIGWDLIIEYAVGNVAVAIAWAAYFHQLCEGIGWQIPAWLAVDVRSAAQAAAAVEAAGGVVDPAIALAYQAWVTHPTVLGIPIIFNALAVGIVMLITRLLIVGVKESARVNAVMVMLKIVILFFFVYAGMKYVKPENWSPFMPNGFAGVWVGASLIFFAYIGFDAISTAAEECRKPSRDLPIGILGSLAICTVIYVAVALVLTGMVPWNKLGVADPLAAAFAYVGEDVSASIVAIGAVASMTAVLLVFQYGQPRIFFSMSRDGLLPAAVLEGPPEVQDPARHHALDRHRRRRHLRLRAYQRDRRADQHRDALCVCPGLRGRYHPAIQGSRQAPGVPNAVRPSRPAPGDCVLRLPHAGASVGDVGEVRALASRRACPVPGVRAQEEQTPLRLKSAPLERSGRVRCRSTPAHCEQPFRDFAERAVPGPLACTIVDALEHDRHRIAGGSRQS